MPDGRTYANFDTGMATALLMLKATELNLIAHPIAGYDQDKAKQVLMIPKEHELITLLIVGKHTTDTRGLSEKQAETEKDRPERASLNNFVFMDRFTL